MASIARAMGASDAPSALFDLGQALGAPTSLKAIGFREKDLDQAAELAAAAPYWNPRPIEAAGLRQLLEAAYHGRRPYA